MANVEIYLRRRFGDIRLRRAKSSGTNLICTLEGNTPHLVAKIAGLRPEDLVNGYYGLRHIEGSGLAPKPEGKDGEPGRRAGDACDG